MDSPVPETQVTTPVVPNPEKPPEAGFPQPPATPTTPTSPVAPTPATDQTGIIPPAEKPKSKSNLLMIIAIVLLLFAIATLGFFILQNFQKGQSRETGSTPTVSPTVTSTPTITPTEPPVEEPVVSTPSSGLKVASPLKVAGTVPAGWMFEGVFPIQLVDSAKKIIVQGQAKEKIPGSWQSGNTVAFEATLTFTTTAKSGFLILLNDNPSGDPAKSKTFEVPVTF